MKQVPSGLFGLEAAAGEPWVHLADGTALANWSDADEVLYSQTNRQAIKYAYYAIAFDYLKENGIIGAYYEFGCHRARTFRMALTEARRHNLDSMEFLAFDSFAGLPEPASEPDHEGWTAGALATSEQEFMCMINDHGIYVDKVETVGGYYDKSLTQELQRELLDRDTRIAMVCVDCDLLESAIPVFNFIEPLLQEGSVLYIDDMYAGYKGSPKKGVARAFSDFADSSSFLFEPHLSVGWWGKSFIVYAE